MVPDDVIADIGGQALDISPGSRVYAQEWHRKDIHSHIHSHPVMRTPKTKSKTLNSPNMTPSFSNPLPVQCCGGLRPGSLVDAPQHCSTSEAFSPRTVLTENICRCVQEIIEHRPAIMPFLTTSTITHSCLASARTRGAWWCRYGGHYRSGPRHLSPWSRVCAREWHSKDIDSHIHSYPAIHTPKTN